MLECVVNVSEGCSTSVLELLSEAAAGSLLDVHADPDHNRSVLTLAGPDVEEAARRVTIAAVAHLDLGRHRGVHPRFGVVDVVPFVPLADDGRPLTDEGDLDRAMGARQRFAEWAGRDLGLPCFLYGPERALPEVRRRAFVDLLPDTGPRRPHAGAGACAVGARPAMVAYNVWLDTSDVRCARALAAAVRGEDVRTMGFAVSGVTQVSCNLVAPWRTGPAAVYDAVAAAATREGIHVSRAELVGLAPLAVVEAVPEHRWDQLDLDPGRTVEARLAALRGA